MWNNDKNTSLFIFDLCFASLLKVFLCSVLPLDINTDVAPIAMATNAEEFQAAVDAILFQIVSNLPELRMDTIANEIVQEGALLVGLQEVTLLKLNGVLFADYGQLLVDKLAEKGLNYEVAIREENFQFAFNGRLITLSNMILARVDVAASELIVSNQQAGTYRAMDVISGLPSPRGWVSVDCKIRGRQFRFVNTHLESSAVSFRTEQTLELIASPALQGSTLPVVLVGDLNADVNNNSEDEAALLLQDAGFVDAWVEVNGSTDPGWTFGYDPNLQQPRPFFERIDYIMTRGDELTILDVSLVDSTISLPPGVDQPKHPSDHKGVVATLIISP